MTEVLKMNPHGFEAMSMDEMLAVDGGGVLGDALIATGGTIAVSAGFLLTVVGVATLNPAVIGAGLGAMTGGVTAIGTVVKK